jgi:DNA-binding MarR family transcriptional regulator
LKVQLIKGADFLEELDSLILRETGMVARCIQSISDINFKELCLQKGQYIYLTRICENPGISLIDLATMLKVDKSSATKAIPKLEEAGYISKRRDDGDKRLWRLYPEKAALRVYESVISEENRNISVCFKGFSDSEKQAALGLMKRMRENIEDDWKEIKKYGGE